MSNIYGTLNGVYQNIKTNINASTTLDPFKFFRFGADKEPDKFPALLIYTDSGSEEPVESARSQGERNLIIHVIIKPREDPEGQILKYLDTIIDYWQKHQNFGNTENIISTQITTWDVAGGSVQGTDLAEAMIKLKINTYGA